VDRIDAGELRPTSRAVARRLAVGLAHLAPADAEILAEIEAGREPDPQTTLRRLWDDIDALPPHQQGGKRLLVTALLPDGPVSGYEAELMISWATEQGVSDEHIVASFLPGPQR
jgi:hypothetical protein